MHIVVTLQDILGLIVLGIFLILLLILFIGSKISDIINKFKSHGGSNNGRDENKDRD